MTANRITEPSKTDSVPGESPSKLDVDWHPTGSIATASIHASSQIPARAEKYSTEFSILAGRRPAVSGVIGRAGRIRAAALRWLPATA